MTHTHLMSIAHVWSTIAARRCPRLGAAASDASLFDAAAACSAASASAPPNPKRLSILHPRKPIILGHLPSTRQRRFYACDLRTESLDRLRAAAAPRANILRETTGTAPSGQTGTLTRSRNTRSRNPLTAHSFWFTLSGGSIFVSRN